ncbi:MAG: hypothetical protein C5B58_07690 [Acidobacteria bacterium]|nr:MAG: hypothetical protein C5B58_07690 [Acidobacteriota bacterium]
MLEYSVFGYSLLFLVSAIVGYIGVYLLRITPDEPMPPQKKLDLRLLNFLRRCARKISSGSSISSHRGVLQLI